MRRTAALAVLIAAALATGSALAASPFPNAIRAGAPKFEENAVLQGVIDGSQRSAANRGRDAWRHPYESLTFWGLQPGMTVIEIDPGAGAWWSEILAPYLAQTGGRYLAGYADLSDPAATDKARQARAAFLARLADANTFGSVRAVDFGPRTGLGVEAGSADMILVARAVHNWARADGLTDRYMAEFFRALKPGGVLALEEQRAAEGADPAAGTGYVPESYVIAAAKKAGFVLEARSELNANAKDTKDYPFGVWTLPPVRRSEGNGRKLTEAERAKYDAVGESDRMTLRFRKPGVS
jgi:predicted methyltransferase